MMIQNQFANAHLSKSRAMLSSMNLWSQNTCMSHGFVILGKTWKLELDVGCKGVNLRPPIITILLEVRSRKQGQHLSTQKINKLSSLAYFITIIQFIGKKSLKD